jgi:hypothetical protein
MQGYPKNTQRPDVQQGDFDTGHGRRYIGATDHMQNDGVSAPAAMPHGYGRRHLIPRDHQVTREDFIGMQAAEDVRLQQGQGRKLIIPFDHVKCDVLKPVDDIAPVKVPTGADMKDAIKDWLVTVHQMFVFDENKWNTEVTVEPRGCHWVIEAFTQQKKSIGREGPSAKLIAEKLAMIPQSDLRHFGVRYAGRNDPKPIRREKHGTFEMNRSLVSPGVQDAIARDQQKGLETTSSTRKHPDQVQRRYISSGQDHFLHAQVQGGDEPGTHGHSKDDDFSDGGLERGMGHGKRYIGTKDHLFDVVH